MYNCRFFDGSVYAAQINNYCWARFPRGSSIASAAVLEATGKPAWCRPSPARPTCWPPAALSLPFTRYDFDGTNPVDADLPDGQLVESFDWVDDNTIICNDYTSGNRKRLYLVDVTAESVCPDQEHHLECRRVRHKRPREHPHSQCARGPDGHQLRLLR